MEHKFIHESKNHFRDVETRIVMETDAVTLHELLEVFEDYLKACGFHMDNLTITLEEKENS